jgi:hypothetical protein
MIGNYLIVPLPPSRQLVLAQTIANVQHLRGHLLHLLPLGRNHKRTPALPEEQILFLLFQVMMIPLLWILYLMRLAVILG